MSEALLIVWRCGNLCLSAVGLVLLVMDVRERRRAAVHGRFYWEGVALFLVAIGYGSAEGALHPENSSLVRTTIATVGLIYFLISISLARRENRRDIDG